MLPSVWRPNGSDLADTNSTPSFPILKASEMDIFDPDTYGCPKPQAFVWTIEPHLSTSLISICPQKGWFLNNSDTIVLSDKLLTLFIYIVFHYVKQSGCDLLLLSTVSLGCTSIFKLIQIISLFCISHKLQISPVETYYLEFQYWSRYIYLFSSYWSDCYLLYTIFFPLFRFHGYGLRQV